MLRYSFYMLLSCTLFTISAFSQKKIFEDQFKNNKNGWRLQHDTSFLVEIKNGALHLEKFSKNFYSRGCLWYNKVIPKLDTRQDFSITLYAKFLSGGDIFDMIDMQWGENSRRIDGRITSSLYQLSFLMKGDVRLEYFNKGWTFFVRKEIKNLLGGKFDPKKINKYELLQKDSFVIFRVNDKEILRHYCPPIDGNSIGF